MAGRFKMRQNFVSYDLVDLDQLDESYLNNDYHKYRKTKQHLIEMDLSHG